MAEASKPPLFGGRYTDSHLNACICRYADQWEVLADGYESAAELLADDIAENRGFVDTLVFPLIYLCRHHVELRLKIIIRDVTWLLGRPDHPPINHKIDKLWELARPLVEQAFRGHADTPPLDIEGTLGEFVAIDPQATTFRFPAKKGEQSPLENVRHINIAQFWEQYEKLTSEVADISRVVRYILDYKLEGEAEMRANMNC